MLNAPNFLSSTKYGKDKGTTYKSNNNTNTRYNDTRYNDTRYNDTTITNTLAISNITIITTHPDTHRSLTEHTAPIHKNITRFNYYKYTAHVQYHTCTNTRTH